MRVTQVTNRHSILLSVTLSLFACGGPATDPNPNAIVMAVVGGRAQTGTAGSSLDSLLAVKVTDDIGRVVAGLTVTFSVPPGAGTISSQHRTDRNGLAVAAWTLPTGAGEYVAIAGTTRDTVTFTATAAAGPGAVLELLSGAGQTGVTSQALEDLIEVRLTDQYGNPVEGTTIAFTATPGNGTALVPSTSSGPTGKASTPWVLGAVAGPMEMRAKAPNLGRIVITATAIPPSP